MSNHFCQRYGNWMTYPDSHRCPPKWEVWCPDEGQTRDDAFHCHATNAEEAAEKWANWYDSDGDYMLTQGSSVVCLVSMVDADDTKTFKVHGEYVTTYYADEVSP